jgi:hypothetical protein
LPPYCLAGSHKANLNILVITGFTGNALLNYDHAEPGYVGDDYAFGGAVGAAFAVQWMVSPLKSKSSRHRSSGAWQPFEGGHGMLGGKAMWEERLWKSGPVQRVFRSSWTWKP